MKTNLSWEEIDERAEQLALTISKTKRRLPLYIYPVPRGGIPAALIVRNKLENLNHPSILVEKFANSNLIIDDIINSGKTRNQFCDEIEDENNFFALINKQTPQDKDIGWVIFPWERMNNEGEGQGPVENIRRLLEYIGEDPERDGLKETPERVLNSYEKLYEGYSQNADDLVKVFNQKCDEIILLKNIEFYSTCEHHMLPFFGKAHIAYIPQNKVIGISKLARILEMFSRRLQIQERICNQVTETIKRILNPQGCACILEAQHFCMTSRGVEKQHSIVVTSSLKGVFLEKSTARAELMSMVKK